MVTKQFFVKGKYIFVTIPQAQKDAKETIKERLLEKEKHLKGFIISQEYHQDKGIHYHILLHYNVYKIIKSCTKYDYLLEKGTHIEKVKDIYKSLSYCKKDNNFIVGGTLEHGIYHKCLSSTEAKKIVYKSLQDGKNIEEILLHPFEEVREYVLSHIKSVEAAFVFLKNISYRKKAANNKGLDYFDIKDSYSENEKILLSKFNEMSKYKWNRPHKTKNIHIFSRQPGLGKTTLLNVLSKFVPYYCYPPINWFKEYTNEVFHCVLWDEFSLVGWDIQFLNLFLEGQPTDLPVKYSFNVTKLDNPLVIMCSNKTLREHVLKKFSCSCSCNVPFYSQELCVSKKCNVNIHAATQYQVLKARIDEIEIKENEIKNILDILYKQKTK